MNEANRHQVGGTHYKNRPHQVWDFIIPMEWSAFQFEVINYVDRYKRKNGIEDLKKARHWLDKLIEIEEAKQLELPLGPAVDMRSTVDHYVSGEAALYSMSTDGEIRLIP